VGLRITQLSLRSFRNYEEMSLKLGEGTTIFVGPNAAGKTNLIEALQLLTAASSFRNPLWSDVVHWGEPAAMAELTAEDEARSVSVRMDIAEGRRSYRVNGQPRKRAADVRGILPSVLFTPDDLRMIKDAAEKRRRAIDEVGEQLSGAYAAAGAEYDRALRQRNALLRDEAAPRDVLQAWTERLADLGAAYTAHRVRLFARIAPRVSEAYSMLSEGESLHAAYLPSWADGEVEEVDREDVYGRILRAFADRSAEEAARRTSVVGPHRDDIAVTIAGKNARSFASQGQQRTAALAWKLAEVQVIEDVSGAPPVLLLDDVMSELDEARRAALARFVSGRVQTVVTTTNIGYFEEAFVENATVVEIKR